MSKNVLIVEQSLAVRGIAESLLRQNGFDVIVIDTADAARQILDDRKIDLLLISSDIRDSQGQAFYEFASGMDATSKIPLLLLHDPSSGIELPFPSEAIINKPFTPRDFMATISAFSGSSGMVEDDVPFEGVDFEDDMIDAALGLDKIEVDGSEVIGNDAGVFRKGDTEDTSTSMVGYESEDKQDDSAISSETIAKINIPADEDPQVQDPSANQQQIQPQIESEEDKGKKEGGEIKPLGVISKRIEVKKVPDLSESSKIEISTDQFGVIAPGEPDQSASDDHDYNWFINELKREAEGGKKEVEVQEDDKPSQMSSTVDSPPPSATPPDTIVSTLQESPAVQEPKESQSEPQPLARDEAVDKFISEFKEEMKKISSDEDPEIPVENIPPADSEPQKISSEFAWNENLEDLSDPEIRDISKDIVNKISEKVAEKIVSRLDENTINTLLKEAIRDYVDNKH